MKKIVLFVITILFCNGLQLAAQGTVSTQMIQSKVLHMANFK